MLPNQEEKQKNEIGSVLKHLQKWIIKKQKKLSEWVQEEELQIEE